MASSKVASRYAKSIVDLARERDELEKINKDMRLMEEVIANNRNFYLMLRSPIVKEDKKKKIFYNVFAGRIEEMTLAFLNIVISKKRENLLPEIVQAFISQYNAINNITPVKLVTAVPVDDALKTKVINILKEKFDKETVELTSEVDENILGGFVLLFEDKLYDASISHQFEELKQQLVKNPYIKNI